MWELGVHHVTPRGKSNNEAKKLRSHEDMKHRVTTKSYYHLYSFNEGGSICIEFPVVSLLQRSCTSTLGSLEEMLGE